MFLQSLKLTNFRNYSRGYAEFSPGITLITGENGAGKTNILEAAQYCLVGTSFRTRKEPEMLKEGETFFRLEAGLETDHNSARKVSYQPGSAVRVDGGGGPDWLEPGRVLSFSPDDLRLIKGPPAVRRLFLDQAISRRRQAHHRRTLDYKKVLSQRNRFLQRARSGLVSLSDITPWDIQLARMSLDIYEARKRYLEDLEPLFAETFSAIAGGGRDLRIRLASQMEAVREAEDPEGELIRILSDSWNADLERLSSGTGSHRDDVEFLLDGGNLRTYGSQGEQRTAVLALLAAECELVRRQGGRRPLLILDDVMSELDPDRRRRLMRYLTGPGQAQVIITAADRELFSSEELAEMEVLEVNSGDIVYPQVGTGA